MVWFDFNEVGERVNLRPDETKRVSLGEEQCWKDLVEGNSQFRKRKNTNLAEESVEILQEKRTQRTRVKCKRKSDVHISMWPKRRKTRVAKEIDIFSLSDVELVESEVGNSLGRSIKSFENFRKTTILT